MANCPHNWKTSPVPVSHTLVTVLGPVGRQARPRHPRHPPGGQRLMEVLDLVVRVRIAAVTDLDRPDLPGDAVGAAVLVPPGDEPVERRPALDIDHLALHLEIGVVREHVRIRPQPIRDRGDLTPGA